MSFHYSAGDIIGLTQLAWQIVQNIRKACGKHDELNREVSGLHTILLLLQHSASPAEPSLNLHNDINAEALRHAISGLRTVLRDLNEMLEKYSALRERQRGRTKLWSKIRFGDDTMLDLGQIGMNIVTHMAVIKGIGNPLWILPILKHVMT